MNKPPTPHVERTRYGCIGPSLFYLMSLMMFALTACVLYSGTDPNGAKSVLASVGTDAATIDALPSGLHAVGFNQSKGLQIVGDTVAKMWNAYLIKEGLIFSLGKYYTQQGKVVDSATTIKLEELRNAKSAADAAAHLKELELLPKPA